MGMKRIKPLLIVALIIGFIALVNSARLLFGESSAQVSGVVIAESGPVAGATVRVQATENVTKTGPDGSFNLAGLTPGVEVTLTAWASGYYIGWTKATPGQDRVTIYLKPYYTTDNPDYTWFSHEGLEGSRSCG